MSARVSRAYLGVMPELNAADDGGAVWRSWFWDAAVALVVVAFSLRILAGAAEGSGFRGADALSFALTAVGAAAIGGGRRRPVTALLISSVAATVLAIRDDHVDVLPFVVAVLLFAVGSYRPRRHALIGLASAAVAFAVTVVSRPADLPVSGVIQTSVVFGAAWALGRLNRARRQALLALVDAAEQQTATERVLAASELERALLFGAQERLRIARELHDVLAHSVSVISVQATVGEHLAAADPSAARTALATIGQVSRASMRELRQMLSVLREDSTPGAPGAPDAVPYEPARGLADLDELLNTYRAAGLPVRATVHGEVHPLPASAQLCAYRIVQEALTNTLTHAGPCTAEVVLRYGPHALLVSVSDDGAGPIGPASGREGDGGIAGHGLLGMRERTALLGGEFTAGSPDDGGFAVSATIPYQTP